jgi:hypothetical protein
MSQNQESGFFPERYRFTQLYYPVYDKIFLESVNMTMNPFRSYIVYFPTHSETDKLILQELETQLARKK